MSFRCYDRARVVGQAFIDCTRNPLEHSRVLTCAEHSHHSIISQTYAHANLVLPEVTRLLTTGDRAEDEKQIKERPMATQCRNTDRSGRTGAAYRAVGLRTRGRGRPDDLSAGCVRGRRA
ncbi:hypothetical protein [Streptomyces sp. NPDC056304]|uniref:hypothetical protein n=1 Tax=Streptomyces sp. NPDC056304 TaxID=3345778 RepID=UPI0035DBF8F0